MTRERRQQLNKEEQEKSNRRSPLSVRSPALEAAEQKRANGTSRSRLASRQSHASRNARHARFAVEETLSRPGVERKKLPKLKAPAAVPEVEREHTGITAGWRVRKKPEPPKPEPPAGISEEEERKLAELEMRLPRVAGKIDSWLLVTVLILLCIGVVMVYSASSFTAARDMGDASFYFQRELIWALLGIVAMFVTMRVDYRQWRRFSLIGIVVVVPLLVIVLKFGVTVYGASRWLTFGSFFSFQPSELTKLVLALYIADWLARKGKQVGTFLYGLAPFVILVGLILGLVLLENDMGTALIIAGLAVAMFFTAGANVVQFLLAMACGGLIFLSEAFKGYRQYRLMGFLHPFQNITTFNLQLYQSLLALGSGGWLGLGLGASRQKTGWLPLPYIDSIFAIIGEELGFIGAALIVILFMFLAFRGFRLARRTQDVYGALLSTGITTWLILQVVINIGSTTGSIPYTGVPLPFISFGGSSLVISLAAVGVLLNISRYIQEPETPALSRDIITKTLSTKKLKKKV